MQVTIGNIFDSNAKTLVNTINCVGVMGKGIALEFKKRYPSMFKEYTDLCKAKLVKPGVPYYYNDLTGASVINFPTKDNWRSPSKLSYITEGLDWFISNYQELGITSVAFPPLGCGNGGLSWDIIGPIMFNKLKNLPIDITIFAPYGTSPEKLREDFLIRNYKEYADDISGEKLGKIEKSWYLILNSVQQINGSRYSLHVGRTIFQKICYVLTREGVNTGFSFVKGSYGPYCDKIQSAVTLLSNANLINESNLGKMLEVTVNQDFILDYSSYNKNELDVVEKTVDLFSRIKNTEQAEIIATVIYSYDQIKDTSKKDVDVFNYVMDWKKRWNGVKDQEIYSTIKNLAILGWIDIIPSNVSIKDLDDI